ncbi:hypothetical protein ACFQ60_20765 [Streptomyces zhihengii]|uniref:Uncharacterized protein n=1 Tax=Streptomyces zhihengii TaxID=1818004 RepID=A0ABS2UUY6_9ACTN|nr:hypothetical protein [Streptomyces zhihengii]MBM9621317.1 hypothetical protein [Streptomyces zhihengii]
MNSHDYRTEAERLLNRRRVTPAEVAQADVWARLATAAAITEAAQTTPAAPAEDAGMFADYEAADQAEYAQFMGETEGV